MKCGLSFAPGAAKIEGSANEMWECMAVSFDIWENAMQLARKPTLNPLTCSGVRWLHFKVLSAIQV